MAKFESSRFSGKKKMGIEEHADHLIIKNSTNVTQIKKAQIRIKHRTHTPEKNGYDIDCPLCNGESI